MKKFLTSTLMTLCFLSVKAHSIWVSTEPVVQLNQPHEIKVYFGEPDDITPTNDWFSDLKDFTLTVTSPSGKQLKVSDRKQLTDHYSLTFTPTEKGVYVIHLKHTTKDLYGKTKLTYFSGALAATQADIATSKTIGEKPLQLQMNATPLQVNQEKKAILLANGQPKKGEKLVVEAENTWKKDLYANDKGEVSFTPLWQGKYQLAYSLSTDEKGNHNGKPFESHYQVITLQLNAK